MVANQDIHEFLRFTEEQLKLMRQRTARGWQDDVALIAGSRKAIAASQKLLKDLATS